MSNTEPTSIETQQNSKMDVNPEIRKPTKDERIARQKELLLNKLAANNLKDISSKVAFILNHYPSTRNSDISLAFKYWETFEPENLPSNGSVDMNTMFGLERMVSIIRARAKIQNEFGLFQADKRIRLGRMNLASRQKEKEIADKPDTPSLFFYLDESGKNQKYTIVGGLCCTSVSRLFHLLNSLLKWKENNKINYEFHYTEMSKNKLEKYKEFFTEAISQFDTISLKAIAVSQKGIKDKNIDDIVIELHYQVIHIGTEHEIETGRITYPRMVTVYKDKDKDIDSIFLEKLRQEVKSGFKKHFDGKLYLQLLEGIPSKDNIFIQIADLFIGSISRVLNRENESTKNHKDEFAEFVISLTGINLENTISTNRDSAFLRIL